MVDNKFGQPKASLTTKIRSVGNSKGVILSSQLIEAAGFNTNADIVIQAVDEVIYIIQLPPTDVNTDLSTWDKQFKKPIKEGAAPDNDPFEGAKNDFDSKEW